MTNNNETTYSDINITDHICQRYIERFNPALEAMSDKDKRLNAARTAIKAILKEARYISDDQKNGILLRSDLHRASIIIRNKTLVTIFDHSVKIKIRERKEREIKNDTE